MKMHNQRGFTLIEVIISIAALGIICAVLLKLFVLAGDTNRRAGDVQEAQVAVASAAETLISSDSMEDGLILLGLPVSEGSLDGRYTLVNGSFNVVLDISEAPGDYPGELFDLNVTAVSGDRELAAIKTAKYYGGGAHD